MQTSSAWLALVFGAAIAGCSGGGSTTPSTTPSPRSSTTPTATPSPLTSSSGLPTATPSSRSIASPSPTPSPQISASPTVTPTPTPTVAAAPLVFIGPSWPASDTGTQEVFTSNLDGSNLTQLTNDGTIKFLPHFSPDGTKIVYSKFLVGGYGDPNPTTVVAVYDLATKQETILTSGGNAFQPVWSPDGTMIAHSAYANNGLTVMDADGSNAKFIGGPSGAPDDLMWADPLWSSDNWIYFVVEQNIDGCLKVRVDRIRPDGTNRTQIDDGGPNCSLTGTGMEPSGDADPAISPDGTTIYSSRGFPTSPPGMPGQTLRHLYAFSTQPYTPGKTETDLSEALEPGCIAGVPKVSHAGTQIAIFLVCSGDPAHAGVVLTDLNGDYFTFVEHGFGADWNPPASISSATSARRRPARTR